MDHPERIGGYVVRDVLGEGGMAVVYLAEQLSPVRRMVALKIIKPGMDTHQVIARFESERQALAVLEHPNIAKVFDAGATAAGRPYFVMELVHGVAITRYCDDRRLGVRARVRLYLDACSAIQHAHQKGLIHRDLKPSNILVDDSDGTPRVKVIDFGIAKAMSQDGSERVEATRLGQLVGTPQYMSPEQAALSSVDVDTRSDVYSLGAVLYELLSGTPPLDLTRVADYAIGIALREQEPPVVSARVASIDGGNEVAAARGTDLRGLQRALRGDLDWIVMRAIAKERARRYETVDALATDLQRYLEQLPVLARPPSTRYVLSRLIRRNKPAALAAVVTFVALLAGVALATVGLVRARAAEQQASAEALASRQVADFMVEVFEVSDPGEARGNTVTAREVLDAAVARMDRQAALQPGVRARFASTMSRVYMELGLYASALPLAETALALRRKAAPPEPLEVAESLDQVGELYTLLSRPLDALPMHEEALAIRRGRSPNPSGEARTLHHLGLALLRHDEFEKAARTLREAEAVLSRGPRHPPLQRATLANDLAQAYHYLDRLADAEPLYREAETILRAELGNDHPRVASTIGDLAILLQDSGRAEDAERAHEEALSIRTKALGRRHPLVASSLNNLALLQMRMREYGPALEHALEAVDISRATLGEEHEETSIIRLNLGRVHVRRGELDDAESHMRAVLEVRRRTLPPGHLELGITLDALTDVLNRRGRFAQAEATAREALQIMRSKLGPEHSRSASAAVGLGEALRGQKRYAEAEPLLVEAYEIASRGRGVMSGAGRRAAEGLIALYETTGRQEDAARYRTSLEALLAGGGG